MDQGEGTRTGVTQSKWQHVAIGRLFDRHGLADVDLFPESDGSLHVVGYQEDEEIEALRVTITTGGKIRPENEAS